jgi:hypothetical protein
MVGFNTIENGLYTVPDSPIETKKKDSSTRIAKEIQWIFQIKSFFV